MDYTFIRVGTNNFAVHFIASMLPSRYTFIIAAYIVEVKDGKSGENSTTFDQSITLFNAKAGCWKNAKLILTDDGVVY